MINLLSQIYLNAGNVTTSTAKADAEEQTASENKSVGQRIATPVQDKTGWVHTQRAAFLSVILSRRDS